MANLSNSTNTMTNSTKASFASLPAELRNVIYNYSLSSSTPITLPYAYSKNNTTSFFREPALLCATKWIRMEAAAIFYSNNIFMAPSPASARRFVSQLGKGEIELLLHIRPMDLALSPIPSGQARWLEGLRRTINRLVIESGKGRLRPEAIEVPIRRRIGDVEITWHGLDEIENLEIVPGEEGHWKLEWRTGFELAP